MPIILDFHISPGRDKGFQVEVFERDSSQPLGSSCFEYDVSFMTEFEVSRLDIIQEEPYERLERLKAFGSKLYKKLFGAGIKKIWQKYKEKSDFLVLCLRIAPEVEKLEVLP